MGNNPQAKQRLHALDSDSNDTFTHSVAINLYPATTNMPQLTIVVVDTIPVELKRSYMVWGWFIYVLAANLLLVIPLLWVAAWWSLRPIETPGAGGARAGENITVKSSTRKLPAS